MHECFVKHWAAALLTYFMSHYTGSMQCWLTIQQHDIPIQKMTVNLQREKLLKEDNYIKAKTFAKENSQKKFQRERMWLYIPVPQDTQIIIFSKVMQRVFIRHIKHTVFTFFPCVNFPLKLSLATDELKSCLATAFLSFAFLVRIFLCPFSNSTITALTLKTWTSN